MTEHKDASLKQSLALLDTQFASLESLNTWAASALGTTGNNNNSLPPLPQIIASAPPPSSPAAEQSSPLKDRFKLIDRPPRILSIASDLDFGNDLLWDALGLEREDLESEENHSGDRLENIGKTLSAGSLSPTPTTGDLFNMADFPSFSSSSEISANSSKDDDVDAPNHKALSSFPLPPAPTPAPALDAAEPATIEAVEPEPARDLEEEKEQPVSNETQTSVMGLGITTEPEPVSSALPLPSAISPVGSSSGFGSHASSMSMDSIEALADDEQPASVAQPRGRAERPRLVSAGIRTERVPSFIGSVGTLEPPSPRLGNFSRLSVASSAPTSPNRASFARPGSKSPGRKDAWGADVARLSLTESGIPEWGGAKAASDDYYAKRMSILNDKMERLKKKKGFTNGEAAGSSRPRSILNSARPGSIFESHGLLKKKSESALRSSTIEPIANRTLLKKRSEPALRPRNIPPLSTPPLPSSVSQQERPAPLRKASAPAALRAPAPPRSPLARDAANVVPSSPEQSSDPTDQPVIKRRSSRFSLKLSFNGRKPAKSPPPMPPAPPSATTSASSSIHEASSKSLKKKASLSSLASRASAKFAPRSPSFRSHKDSVALRSAADIVPALPPSPLPSPGLSSLPSPSFSESSFRPSFPSPSVLASHSAAPSPAAPTPASPVAPALSSPFVEQHAQFNSNDTAADDVEEVVDDLELRKVESTNTSCFVEQMDDDNSIVDAEPLSPLLTGSNAPAVIEDGADSRGRPSLSIETDAESVGTRDDAGSLSSFEAHVMTASKVASPKLAACPLPPVMLSTLTAIPLVTRSAQAVIADSPPVLPEIRTSNLDPSPSTAEAPSASLPLHVGNGQDASLPPSPVSPGFPFVTRPRRGSSIGTSAFDYKSQFASALSLADDQPHPSPLLRDGHEGDEEQEEIIATDETSAIAAPESTFNKLNASTETYDSVQSSSSNAHGTDMEDEVSPDATSVEDASSVSSDSFKESVEDQRENDRIDFTQPLDDLVESSGDEDDKPLAQMIPQATQVQHGLADELSRSSTPEPVGHSMLPQTDDAVRKRSFSAQRSPSLPLDPAIAESTLMLSDSPPTERIALAPTTRPERAPLSPSSSASLATRRAGSPEKRSTRTRPALKIDVPAPPMSWTSAPRSPGALLSPPPRGHSSASSSPRSPTSPRKASREPQVKVHRDAPPVTTKADDGRSPRGTTAPKSPLSNVVLFGDEEPRKVYIVDSKDSFMAPIGSRTRCGDVVELARSQGLLTAGQDADGGWALWEACIDAGLERPCREYEMLADVIGSWDDDWNILIIRRTQLYPLISAGLRPQPLVPKIEQVQIELKKGKWTKRYLRVDKGAVFVAKSAKGKDAVLLCKLNTFEAFFVAPKMAVGAPRPAVFALKSSVKKSQYEQASEHSYQVAVKTADEVVSWVRSIIEARNDFLRQREVDVLGRSSMPRSDTASSKPLFSPVLPPSPMLSSHPPSTTTAPPSSSNSDRSMASQRLGQQAPPGLGPVQQPRLVNVNPNSERLTSKSDADVERLRTTKAVVPSTAARTAPPDFRMYAPTAGAAIRIQEQSKARRNKTLIEQREDELHSRRHDVRMR